MGLTLFGVSARREVAYRSGPAGLEFTGERRRSEEVERAPGRSVQQLLLGHLESGPDLIAKSRGRTQ